MSRCAQEISGTGAGRRDASAILRNGALGGVDHGGSGRAIEVAP